MENGSVSFRTVRDFSSRVNEVVRVNCFDPDSSLDSSTTEGYRQSFLKVVKGLVSKGKLPAASPLEIMTFLDSRYPHLLVGCSHDTATVITEALRRFRFPYNSKTDLLFPSLPSPAVQISKGKIAVWGANVREWTATEDFLLVCLTFDPVNFGQSIKVRWVKSGKSQPVEEFETLEACVAVYGEKEELAKALTDASNRLLYSMRGGSTKTGKVFLPERCPISFVPRGYSWGDGAFISITIFQEGKWQLVQMFSAKKGGQKFRVAAIQVEPQKGVVVSELQGFNSITPFLVEMDALPAELLEALEEKLEAGLEAIFSRGRINSELRDELLRNGVKVDESRPPEMVASAEPPPASGEAAKETAVDVPAEPLPGTAETASAIPSATDASELADTDHDQPPEKPGRNRRANRREVNQRHQGKNGGKKKE